MLMPADRVHEVLGSQFASPKERPDNRNDASPVQAISGAQQLIADR